MIIRFHGWADCLSANCKENWSFKTGGPLGVSVVTFISGCSGAFWVGQLSALQAWAILSEMLDFLNMDRFKQGSWTWA
jgi:hypothetical protein